MGLFDFLKKRVSRPNEIEKIIDQPVDNNFFLLEKLKERLIAMGFQVENHKQYLALIINSQVEIATAIIDNPGNHPSIIHLMVLTISPAYFPNGIEENIVGVGTTIEGKVNSVLDNYLKYNFCPHHG